MPVNILVGLGAFATRMTIVATSGPGCPVESNPPDPACAPRPVVGAKVVVKDGFGAVVADGTSGLTDTVDLVVSPGLYMVEASSVEGLVGTPEPKSINVTDGTARSSTWGTIPASVDRGQQVRQSNLAA